MRCHFTNLSTLFAISTVLPETQKLHKAELVLLHNISRADTVVPCQCSTANPNVR